LRVVICLWSFKTDTFLFCFKKEFAQAKKQGNTDEREADAVSSSLFSLLVLWAVEEGNVFVWVFCLFMWHLMARSCNVSSVVFRIPSCSSMMKQRWTKLVSLSKKKCIL
jgi:hypothetical protein